MMDNNQFDNNEPNQEPKQNPQTPQRPVRPANSAGNGGEPPRKKRNSGLWKIALVALVSALIGGGVAYAGISAQLAHQNSAGDTTVSSSSEPGTTQVSNVTMKNSTSMTNAFNKNKNAVVSVVNLQKESNEDSSDPFAGLFGDSDDSDSGSSSKGSLEEYGEGSGVIYANQNGKGYIVTNYHVVEGSDSLQVILSDGTKTSAKLVGTDSLTDLAVLTIDSKYVKGTATFGNSDAVTPGEPVIAIGSPLGSQYATSVTQGIISAKSRTVDITNSNGQATGQATVIQTDTAINPGNSGGPLVNAEGQVVGINSMKLAQSNDGTTVEGMGFAIPSNEVVKIINQLVKNGKVVRPALGVRVIDLSTVDNSTTRTRLKIPTSLTEGVVIASVDKGTPAANAGLKAYDVITALNGKAISGVAQLHTQLYNFSVGDKVTITYYRGSSKQTATVTLSQTQSQVEKNSDSSSSTRG
ncbi:S1C family serine protease [Schleiferilactobacillus shenzhenensis]|uniref:HtrA n=1 Tax=Schleiferilactobacillus shenzhenensis LY-73 TaxID=1231336 RepID=U4TVA4_9LACO|nr:trypsin-like peptidase domain-containing protein [Schleiferilactobacillus shenzhenensis]ERL65798.1 HtrA [Schleiferilactobacillus shenzhenensis LY-73]